MPPTRRTFLRTPRKEVHLLLTELLRFAAEQDAGGVDVAKLLNQFVQYGPIGLFLILLLIGFIVPKWAMDALTREKDSWRQAFEKERDAHEVTRQQLAKAEERGDVAVEQGKTLTHLLEELGHRPELRRTGSA